MSASRPMSADASVKPLINNWKTGPLVIVVFAVLFGSLTITSLTQQSPTIDEPVHLLGGYSYLKWRDFRVNPEHPPLVKMWAALPLLWMDVRDPRSANSLWKQILESEPGGPVYPFAREMFFTHNDASKLFFYAKLQMVILSIVLAVFVFLWSRELFGLHAAVVSLILYGLDPTVLAHSAIIHTDLPLAAWFFIGTYFFWRALRESSWLNLVLVSLMFGLAAITKHSFVVIALIWFVLGTVECFRAGKPATPAGLAPSCKQRLIYLAAIFSCAAVTAYLLIWAAYGFRFSAAAGEGARLFMTQVLPAHRVIAQPVSSFVLEHRLFPEALVAGYLYNLKVWRHSSYLLGELSGEGFWSYFPIAFIVKTPLPTLLLLAASLGLIISRRKASPYLWLIVPALLYFALAVLSRFNIGIRHLLPIYPFLFVLIGAMASEFWRGASRISKSALVVLGFWYLGSVLVSYPHYLSYFNELVGGAKNGHKVLLDSNLDWGQDLKGLKKWLDANGVKKVQSFYFGTADPKYYGIDDFYSTENLAGGTLDEGRKSDLPEYLAISANFLYGGELFLPKELVELLQSYRLDQPVGRIGDSILVYKLNLADSRVYENAAVMTARKGASALAERLLEKALRINPASANGHFQLAALLAQRGEWNQAAENFRETLRIKPGHADAHYALAQIFKRQGRIDEAAHHYQEALRILKANKTRAKRAD